MSALNNITFAIPTYNRNDYLVEILTSLPPNANVVVSDNGGYVTQEIKDKFSNFRFVTPEHKLEMYQNWNFCIKHIDTKWFVIPSDDDLYYPDKIDELFKVLDTYPDYSTFIFGHYVIDEHGEILESWCPANLQKYEAPYGYEQFKYGVDARLPSIIFNTELANKEGLFKEEYTYTAADSLLIQTCLLNSKSIYIPYILAAYRVWPENFTSKLIATKGWLDKIDLWQSEIGVKASAAFKAIGLPFKKSEVKDEVYARNLISGLKNLKGSFSNKKTFFKQVRYPYKASLRSHYHIVKSFLFN